MRLLLDADKNHYKKQLWTCIQIHLDRWIFPDKIPKSVS